MTREWTNKLRYFCGSALKGLLRRGLSCPSCGASGGAALDRKWGVTAMRRCSGCGLLFRTPTTSAAENAAFYQEDYEQGFTTDMPPEQELAKLLKSQFEGEDKNYSGYVKVLRALAVADGAKLFDYGCSWGYGSWQLRQAGYAVDSYEISQPRARYAASHLGVTRVDPQHAVAGSYDVFFSAHVIEHVPSVSAMIDLGMRLLKPGGLFVAFTPNGSMAFRELKPSDWHLMWGLAHPQLLDVEYVTRAFAGKPLLLSSAPLHLPEHGHPVDDIAAWQRNVEPHVLGLEHVEMMFAVVKS